MRAPEITMWIHLSSSGQDGATNKAIEGTVENFITAFIVYFAVIDPVGTRPIFLAITTNLNKRQKICTTLKRSFVTGAIMLFFAICGVWFCIIWIFRLPHFALLAASSCFWWRSTCLPINSRRDANREMTRF